MSRWFRLYDTVVDDPKVQRLPDAAFRAWINFMCIASRNDGCIPDDLADVAFSMRMSEEQVVGFLTQLQARGLIDAVDGGYEPHEWKTRQYQSDNSTERSRKSRERKRNDAEAEGSDADATPCNVASPLQQRSWDAAATPPEQNRTEQSRTETERDLVSATPSPSKPKTARATRWPDGQPVPPDWIDRVRKRLTELGRPLPDLPLEAEKFVSYWTAQSGQRATKTNWGQTFYNWCLNAKTTGNRDYRGRSTGFDALREGAMRAAGLGRGREELEGPTDNLVRLGLSGPDG